MEEKKAQRGEHVIAGRNAVKEALRSNREIDSLYIVKGSRTGNIAALIAKAKEKGATIKEVDGKKLDFFVRQCKPSGDRCCGSN